MVAASWKNGLIRDPVVLVAILSMESPAAAEERGGGLADAGRGLLANHQVSFTASVSHVFLPASTVCRTARRPSVYTILRLGIIDGGWAWRPSCTWTDPT